MMDHSTRDPALLELIYSTLAESVNELSRRIQGIGSVETFNFNSTDLMALIDETRKLVIFLNYSSQYLRRFSALTPVQEEILRIKLHLLATLRALADRVRVRDHHAAHDLITEELRANLTMWKINVLPLMRRHSFQRESGLTLP